MSGGHTTNPGFSSTTDIHIYTGKFSQVTYNATSGTAVIGSGLVWEAVYERLQPYNVTVLGGRVSGVSGYPDPFGRSQSCHITDRRRWLRARRRLVYERLPVLCTLTGE